MIRGRWLAPLLIVMAGLLAYGNSLNGPVIFDGLDAIATNESIRHLRPLKNVLTLNRGTGMTVEGRPVANLSFAIDLALFGPEVVGFHFVNLVIHILAALTLFGIVRRTLRGPKLISRYGEVAGPLACVVALLWVVHPLQTESVTYIVQRVESLMGLFYLLTLYCFIRGTQSSRPWLWYALSVLACAPGMGCKEVMITVPLVVVLYDWIFSPESIRATVRRRWPVYASLLAVIALWVAGVAFTGIKRNTTGDHSEVTWWTYALSQPNVILHYLWLTVWPQTLCLDYGWPIATTWRDVLPGFPIVALLLAATVRACWRRQAAGFLGASFFLILAPTSSVLPLMDLAFEHRMYLPLAAASALVVIGGFDWLRRTAGVSHRWVSLGLAGAVVIALGLVTWRRNEDYRTEIGIWRDTVAKRPLHDRPWVNLGAAHLRQGLPAASIPFSRQAMKNRPLGVAAYNNLGVAFGMLNQLREAAYSLQQACLMDPTFGQAKLNFGLILLRLGRTREGTIYMEEGLRSKSDAAMHNGLGVTLAFAGKTKNALAHFEEAARLRPDSADVHNGLGNALLELGKTAEAIPHFEEALRIHPGYPDAHYNLALALLRSEKVPEAIAQFKKALRLRPEYAEAHNNLGVVLQQGGDLAEAMHQYQEALRIRPDYAEAENNLAFALEKAGKTDEAIAHYEAAVKIAPRYAQAHNNLGNLLFHLGRIDEASRHWELAEKSPAH